MLDFLPQHYINSIKNLDINKLFEIRIRALQKVIINYNFNKFFLGTSGILKDSNGAITATNLDIENIISALTEKSLYAYNENIKDGFLTSKNGVRVGLCGTMVVENGKIITLKNISSLCIRIPHEIIGCSNDIFYHCLKNTPKNLLIISPPGYGKTTILKDLIRNYNQNTNLNLLVIDERGELAVHGKNIDVLKQSNKEYAIQIATKSMSPDVMFMDELMTNNDFLGAYKAKNSGIKVIATAHAENVYDLLKKFIKAKEVFDYFILLNKGNIPGEIKAIYNSELNEI